MRLYLILFIGIVGIIVILTMRLGYMGSIERLLMPGPLAAGHDKYEDDCAKCHHAFKKRSQDDLCLDCHKGVAEDMKTRAGLHGGSSPAKEKQCRSCHSDHKGRDFGIVQLDKETFDHNLTDFTLAGAHARAAVTCEACHFPGKKYREAPKDCLSCHADNDKHKGRLGTDCAGCHRETRWNDVYFDHKKTRFPLEDKHRQVTCNACHANESYKNTPVNCVSCHLINDIHASTGRQDCGQCHSVGGWNEISYDHNQKTEFILKDRHAELKCDSCHQGNLFNENKPRAACSDCHKTDDIHKGKNGVQCESCHSAVKWDRISFDHNIDTDFKLFGRHIGLQCEACHKDSSGKMKIDASCRSCHGKEDIHKSREATNCELCHSQNGWEEEIRFDHDLTNFPLIGLHAVVSCGECHLSSVFKDSDTDCISCHRRDDYHKGALGASCAECHNPNGWKFWEFDHDTRTSYKLEGGHKGLGCQLCHRRPVGKDAQLSGGCVSCHDDDDAHHGGFGRQCDRCHTVGSFKKESKDK